MKPSSGYLCEGIWDHSVTRALFTEWVEALRGVNDSVSRGVDVYSEKVVGEACP